MKELCNTKASDCIRRVLQALLIPVSSLPLSSRQSILLLPYNIKPSRNCTNMSLMFDMIRVKSASGSVSHYKRAPEDCLSRNQKPRSQNFGSYDLVDW